MGLLLIHVLNVLITSPLMLEHALKPWPLVVPPEMTAMTKMNAVRTSAAPLMMKLKRMLMPTHQLKPSLPETDALPPQSVKEPKDSPAEPCNSEPPSSLPSPP